METPMAGHDLESGAPADWKHGQCPRVPFTVCLEDGDCLEYRALYRVLPGKRLAGLALWRGQRVFAKLFLGDKADKQAQRDKAGSGMLAKAGIRSPALLAEVRLKDESCPVLLYEYLGNAKTFWECWHSADPDIKGSLLDQLVALFAHQHQAGICQKDAHLDNFLVYQGKVYAIDGGEYRDVGAPLGINASEKNLGLLFAQFPRKTLRDHADVVKTYAAIRGWGEEGRHLRSISILADGLRHRRARQLAKKVFRNCTEFRVRKMGDFSIYQRRDLPREQLDSWLRLHHGGPAAGETVLKAGGSQTVWESDLNGMPVVVKRYNLKTPWHALRRFFTRSRASRSWENAHRLRAYHIATPRPLAMIEERWGPLRRRAWLITERAKGEVASRYLQRHPDDASLARLADMVAAFGENGLVHGDMKATNFIMSRDSVEVIDLDAMRRPLTAPARRAGIYRDRQRFLQNWKGELREAFRRLLDA